MSQQERRGRRGFVLLVVYGIALAGLWGCEESPPAPPKTASSEELQRASSTEAASSEAGISSEEPKTTEEPASSEATTVPEEPADAKKTVSSRKPMETEPTKPEPTEPEPTKPEPTEPEPGTQSSTGPRAAASTVAEQPAAPTEKLSPEQEVLAALDDAIASLKKTDYRKFCTHYMPVRDFQQMRDSGRFETVINGLWEHPEVMQQLLDMLKRHRDFKPTFDETGLLATFAPSLGDDEKKPPQPAVLVAAPEDDRLELSGFGGDLQSVIKSAIAALEKDELQTFIDRMFPAGELGRLKANKETDKLLARLRGNKDMVQQMIADLKAIQDKKPELDATQTVATFVVPVPAEKPQNGERKLPKPLDKTFKFQKVDGNWRLFDNSTKVRQEMARQAKLAPPRIKAPPTNVLVMEKLGTCWRIARFPQNER